MTFNPKPFGKYFLIDKIAVGGMAEIYKAKTFGVDGFEKLLAIKKILPNYSADKEFISMLTDEAKLVVRLSHTNIVQIYDLGKVGDDYYISMEYIDGVNLREVMNRGKELKQEIPLPLALYMISEVCKGLDYAHNKKDDHGQSFGIVHRDVSPQNILISFEGETKIVDFGIAKAAMNISHTTAGILKGKITYMAPEQALGKPIDAKIDIFSTGILLYEMITHERLFSGDTQFEVLKKIRTTEVTEKNLNKSIPPELRPVLAKALAHNPQKRYETAGDFQIALTKILYSKYSDFSPKQLSTLIHKWFADELQIKKKNSKEEASIDSQTKSILIGSTDQESLVDKNKADNLPILQDTTKPEDALKPEDLLHEEEIDKSEEKTNTTITQAHSRRIISSKIGLALSFVFLLVLAGGAYYYLTHLKPKPPQTTATLTINSNPTGVRVFLDGEDTQQITPAILNNLELQTKYVVRLDKEGFNPWEQEIFLDNPKGLDLNVTLESIPENTIQITSTPTDADIFLNEEPLNKKTPSEIEDLKTGVTYKIKLVKKGYQSETVEITMGDETPEPLNIKLNEIVTGSVKINSNPQGAKIFLNGEDTQLITPNKISNLEVGKNYLITIQKEKYRENSQTINIDTQKIYSLDFNLEFLQAVKTAKVKIESNISNVDVLVDGNKLGLAPNIFELKPGKYKFGFTKKGYETQNKTVDLKEGDLETISITMLKETTPSIEDGFGTMTITSNPSGATVSVDGKIVGKTPLTKEVKSGSRNISLTLSGYTAYHQSVKINKGQSKSISATLNTQINHPSGTGDVRIDSTPRGAAVLMNGQKAGITPVVIPHLQKGQSHTIILTLPGYQKWVKSFNLNQNHLELTAQMQRE